MCLIFNVCACVIKSAIIYYVCIFCVVTSADLNFINQVNAAVNKMTQSHSHASVTILIKDWYFRN